MTPGECQYGRMKGTDSTAVTAVAEPQAEVLTIRGAAAADMTHVCSLDGRNTGLEKPQFWQDAFRRYASDGVFLIAEREGAFLGYIVGEVRAWEFGSPPSGWIFAFGVEPDARLGGIASALFRAICDRFREQGVDQVRSMVATGDLLNLAFLRAQGMRGGPYLQLEMPLNGEGGGR